jgi:15-cis-phytoene synthase
VRRELVAAGIYDPLLQASYQTCRRLNARNGKTYYLATLLLPAAKRPYVHALYGFARFADDLVDLDSGLSNPERVERFRSWSNGFLDDLTAGHSDDAVGRALVDTVQRWQIPTSRIRDFLDSMAMDLALDQYETFADLERYMWGSAAVIGLQMLPILGRDPGPSESSLEPYAIDLGVAFQLTNFLRDVGEDLDRGRVYLPMESLRQFGVDRAMLMTRQATEPVRALIAFEVARARMVYRRAAPGIDLVAPSSRACLRTAFTLYSEILDEIERAGYDVFSRRATVPNRRRALVAGRGLLSAWAARRADAPATPTSST